HGVLDLSYLSMMPNMVVMAPKNKWELADMLWFASRYEGPAAIRYPRGQAYDGLRGYRAPVRCGKSEWIYEELQIAIFAVGAMVETALDVHRILHDKGYDCSLINARFVKPIDRDSVKRAVEEHVLIVTIEENMLRGGFGEAVGAYLDELNADTAFLRFGIEDQFVCHGTVSQLREKVGLGAAHIAQKITEAYDKL
ncbi:MAG: 1-deoxy-D-xylulose-5-phosphate synthase, partial [Clostridiales bacterium]|nr:1-deoxy-D-xylulose-5-phosphate synthase [Clostridiales bacterium]